MDTILRVLWSSWPSEVAKGNMPPNQLAMLSLSDLPGEIIHQVLAYLDPLALVQLSQTCRTLRSHAENDLLWARLVQGNLPLPEASPSPCSSWKELYTSHYPYWFLPRYKIWFADKSHTGNQLTGQLIVARYDHWRGCIEAYRLVAEQDQGNHTFVFWEWNRNVVIHVFNPEVQLWLDDPIVQLDLGIHESGSRLRKEIPMRREVNGRLNAIHSRIFLSRAIPAPLQNPSMALWPPKILPVAQRVRNDSPTAFRDDAHKPSRLDEVSDTTFRIRKWMEFRGMAGPLGVRMGEDVMTFGTLPAECYTPTEEKPYQGIWVGDYAGHGCEFLLIIQRDVIESTGPPGPIRISEAAEPAPPNGGASAGEAEHTGAGDAGQAEHTGENNDAEAVDPVGCQGRLEAIKLTGDPNVPRGEYTWIAEDIGRRGLIRIAEEERFEGARIVKSWGHIAARGFRDDSYIPSQLIMISHDSLAQYWVEFGHISFFSRVNIGDYLDVEAPEGST